MTANRRKFLSTALGGGLASVPLRSFGAAISPEVAARYRKLDEVLSSRAQEAVLPSPVVIESVTVA
ncbi:MAG: hypothetical protein HC858_09225 [Brachymonas sp.]|nr:hypothetical protein [Brachymonas sp.]